MSFVSEIEALFATGSLKWSSAINEKDRVIYIMFFAKIREKTDLRERYFSSFQAVYVGDRLIRDRQQRTANSVHR